MEEQPVPPRRSRPMRVPYQRVKQPGVRSDASTRLRRENPQQPLRRREPPVEHVHRPVPISDVELVRRPAPASEVVAPRASRMASKVTVAVLLGLVVLAVWQIFFVQHAKPPQALFLGLVSLSTPVLQIPPLLADGISLGAPNQKPALDQSQALLMAGQLEADAATSAQHVEVRYVLLNYSAVGNAAAHATIMNKPAWLIWYKNIPLPPADTDVDPTPMPHLHHDLYVFLDAHSGNELLSVWI